MKVLFIAATLALASAGFAPSCEECNAAAGGLLGEWTCDDCTAVMTGVAEFMKEPDTIAQGVEVLTGECFCGAAGHTAECPNLVNGLAAPCMEVLSAVLMETPPELCQDIVGVC